MSSTAIMYTLLTGNSALVAQVAKRVYSGTIPVNTTLPCLGLTEVSVTEVPHIDANSPTQLVDARVQVTVLAGGYPAQKSIVDLVRKACNYQRGMLAGYEVASVRRLSTGPEFQAADTKIFMQTVDFAVLFYEATK